MQKVVLKDIDEFQDGEECTDKSQEVDDEILEMSARSDDNSLAEESSEEEISEENGHDSVEEETEEEESDNEDPVSADVNFKFEAIVFELREHAKAWST